MAHMLITPHASALDGWSPFIELLRETQKKWLLGLPLSKFIIKQLLRLPLCAICLPLHLWGQGFCYSEKEKVGLEKRLGG